MHLHQVGAIAQWPEGDQRGMGQCPHDHPLAAREGGEQQQRSHRRRDVEGADHGPLVRLAVEKCPPDEEEQRVDREPTSPRAHRPVCRQLWGACVCGGL